MNTHDDAPLGIIGGSGFYSLPALQNARTLTLQTPFGAPSAPLSFGRWGGRDVVFLPRHGLQHTRLPSEINARANFYALKAHGVRQVIGVSAVGSLAQTIAPGHTVLVDQFIDRTTARPNSFFGDGIVAHVSLADPTCAALRQTLTVAAQQHVRVHPSATYVCIEGPQFSTRAESHLLRSWGAHVVGMTGLPEARLAREAELCYALVALPTDFDAWKTSEAPVTADAVAQGLAAARDALFVWLPEALAALGPCGDCSCQRSLDAALLTPAEALTTEVLQRLGPIVRRRLGML